jgi:GNAT superfamily N-acetyltransferase
MSDRQTGSSVAATGAASAGGSSGASAARGARSDAAGGARSRAAKPGAAGGVEIVEVRTRRELTSFIKLPWRLYQGVENWVPPLISERRKHLSEKQNPFFEHAEASYFLALRGGVPVGRIGAHVDHRLNEFQDNRWGMFGFFECENDQAAAAALLDVASKWLRQRDRDRIAGPFNFSTNHEVGVLIEGHELRPQILEDWHHPYYRELLEGCGMQKAMDLYKWEIMTADHGEMLPIFDELAARLEPDHGIVIRNMRKRDFASELKRFMEVYNAAWERNWGFVPLTDREIEHMAKELKPILDEDFALVAEQDGEVVGVSLSLPDFNHVLARVNGRLLPLGWLTALREQRKIDEVRVFALGVKRKYHHTGVAAAFYANIWNTCERRGIRRVETGWILESNEPMNRAMEALVGKIVKRYRVFERML